MRLSIMYVVLLFSLDCDRPLFFSVHPNSHLTGPDLMAEKVDCAEFVDVLKKMLTMDQERRIGPGEALHHPFLMLSHLASHAHSSYVKQSVQLMNVCHRPRRQLQTSASAETSRAPVFGTTVPRFDQSVSGLSGMNRSADFGAIQEDDVVAVVYGDLWRELVQHARISEFVRNDLHILNFLRTFL